MCNVYIIDESNMVKDNARPKQAFNILSFYSQQSIHVSIVQHSQRKPT